VRFYMVSNKINLSDIIKRGKNKRPKIEGLSDQN
jgi:hypothetical protein